MPIPIIGSETRHKVLLGLPYGDQHVACWTPATAMGIYQCSKEHDVISRECSGSWGNFNILLAMALNLAADGKITHYAMLHSDISPQPLWMDIMLSELDRLDADMISAVVPIKDPRGVTSSGIGDTTCPWHPLRRFTMEEVCQYPATFNAADAGYPGGMLLHNDGCVVMDLRKPVFHKCNDSGELFAAFNFPRRIIRGEDGKLIAQGESEDWYWSRMLHELGANTYCTRKVGLEHNGAFGFPNTGPWGVYQDGDKDTEYRWKKDLETMNAG